MMRAILLLALAACDQSGQPCPYGYDITVLDAISGTPVWGTPSFYSTSTGDRGLVSATPYTATCNGPKSHGCAPWQVLVGREDAGTSASVTLWIGAPGFYAVGQEVTVCPSVAPAPMTVTLQPAIMR
jgi:hypothetical protein